MVLVSPERVHHRPEREVQQHEAVFGGAATKAGRSQGRDDSASQAMYKMKSVSVGVFDRRL